MKSKIIFLSFILFSVILLNACSPKYGVQLQNGDILLVSAGETNLSGAIDRVTQTGKSTHYSHIALLEKTGKKYWVLHADTRNGSERLPLSEFLRYEEEDKNSVDVYRLKPAYRQSIPHAIQMAKIMLGKPYNYTYILSDTAYYCSDFVQRAFAHDSIFALNPMTFKNAAGRTDSVWIAFYQKLHLEIPEGKPGCNPNGMAASQKIYFVGVCGKEETAVKP